jgi:hypothetical protein
MHDAGLRVEGAAELYSIIINMLACKESHSIITAISPMASHFKEYIAIARFVFANHILVVVGTEHNFGNFLSVFIKLELCFGINLHIFHAFIKFFYVIVTIIVKLSHRDILVESFWTLVIIINSFSGVFIRTDSVDDSSGGSFLLTLSHFLGMPLRIKPKVGRLLIPRVGMFELGVVFYRPLIESTHYGACL